MATFAEIAQAEYPKQIPRSNRSAYTLCRLVTRSGPRAAEFAHGTNCRRFSSIPTGERAATSNSKSRAAPPGGNPTVAHQLAYRLRLCCT
jgi:hypothetical protein